MVQVTELRPTERVVQDRDLVAAIYRDLGQAAAERMIRRALVEMLAGVNQLTAAVRARDLQDVPRQMQRLRVLADGLGLVSLAAAAQDLRICLERGDSTGFSAVLARLLRISELSLGHGQSFADCLG